MQPEFISIWLARDESGKFAHLNFQEQMENEFQSKQTNQLDRLEPSQTTNEIQPAPTSNP